MNYKEMGFSKEDVEFLKIYPRLYAIASTMGIEKEYFDSIFSKMDNSLWLQTQTNKESKQTYLRSMLVRLSHFRKSSDLSNYKQMSPQELSDLFGKYNVKFACELLKVL